MPEGKTTVTQVNCKNLIKQDLSASFWLLVLQLSGNTTSLARASFYRYRKGLAAIEQEIGCSSLNRSIWNLTDSCIVKAEPGSGHWVLAESSVVATVQIAKVVLGRKEGRLSILVHVIWCGGQEILFVSVPYAKLKGNGNCVKLNHISSLTYIVSHFTELLIYCTHWLLSRLWMK